MLSRFIQKIKRTGVLTGLLMAFVFITQPVLPALCAENAAEDSVPAQDSPKIVDPVGHNESYSAVIYDNRNGLPASVANDIAQTGDGFLWIASYSGLIRYDGNIFERIESGTALGNIGCLFVDSRDRLWIGTNDSGIGMMEKGVFRIWGEADGLSSSKVLQITEDTNGTIYISTTSGVQMFDGELNLSSIKDPRIRGSYVDLLVPGSGGKLYGMTVDDDIFVLRGSEVLSYIRNEEISIHGIVNILPDPDNPGMVYLGTEDTNLYYGSVEGGLTISKVRDISPLNENRTMKLIGDRIWICGRNGIGVIDGEEFHFLDELPMNNSVDHVIADYEGNLWFTSSRQGVMKIVPNQFLDLFERYGISETVVNTTCLSGDRLFVGTDTGLIVLEKTGVLSELPLKSARSASGEDLEAEDLLEMLDGCRIRSIIRDSNGRLWISTWRAYGVLRYDDGEVISFNKSEGLISDHIRTVYEHSDGSILVVNSGGLSVIEGDRVTASYTQEDGIANPESLTVTEGTDGDILLGSNGGGIYVINREGVRCIGTSDGLSSGIVMRIKHDPVRNIFWIITGNSIAYMTEDYRVTTIRNFPYSNNLDLVENKDGEMWIISGNGIFVLPADDLLSDGVLKPVFYGIANGLPCIATSNSHNELTEDGDLYISGNKCVVKVNIDNPAEDTADLKLTVPYVDADGVRLYPDEDGSFRISSDVQKLTVYSYVFNYSLTDPQVSYKLEGFDRETVTVSRSSLTPVSYTNLPGGTYKFVFQLRDSKGQNSKAISVPIVKAKAVYEQPWFFAILFLAFFLCAAAIIRLYIRRKTIALEKKNREAVKQERLNTELKMANQIQEGMLVHDFPPFPERTEFDVYASMKPAREVGGDFYDIFLIDDDHLAMVMADVSGKGIPAALFMMVSKVIVQSCAMLGKTAGEILTKTNEAICSNNQVEMFVTVWVGILEISTGKVSAANAGHEYPAVRQKGGGFVLLKDRHGLVIGGMEGSEYTEYEIELEPGDKLFVYTDGVPEAADSGENMFGTGRMLEALNRDADAPPEQILQNVQNAVDDFVKDAEQFDDLTMLCMEYKGAGHPEI